MEDEEERVVLPSQTGDLFSVGASGSSRFSSRAQSAVARIQTPPRDLVIPEFRSTRRAQSANCSRSMSSKSIFPEKERREPDTPKTMYSDDYSGTFSPRAVLRPSSPTRRHNPHPSSSFLHWRVPTDKQFDNEALRANHQQLEQNATRRFYQEYQGQGKQQEDGPEVLTSLTKLRVPVVEPTSRTYGKHDRQAFSTISEKSLPDINEGSRHRTTSRPAVAMTMKKDTVPAMEAWLDTAKPKDQNTIMSMMRSAEDSCVKQSIERTMQPAAVPGVHQWMKHAPEEERAVAIRLFERLASADSKTSDGGQQLRVKSNRLSGKSMRRSLSEGSALQLKKENLANQEKRRSATDSFALFQMEPSVWHHRSVRDPPPRVIHRGSVFGSSKHRRASHFTIHPEWPDFDD